MNEIPKTVVGLGEILWDLLPQGALLGGAPANFAYHASRLGNSGVAASRIGNDKLGDQIVDQLKSLNLSTEFIQRDPDLPTGTVNVEVSAEGQPHFTIVENVAWDNFKWTPEWERLAAQTDAVCFGSLAQRRAQSREIIIRFLTSVPPSAVKIFDINLRGSFFDSELIEQGIKIADIVKMNDEELPRVAEMLKVPFTFPGEAAREILLSYELKMICITRGAKGSLIMAGNEVVADEGYEVEVADTIGAGDAFVAVVAHHVLCGSPIKKISDAANILGAYVATQSGATPAIPENILSAVL